jgi:hypothetical protein
VGTVVSGADARNIEAVFIAGQIRKWSGRLVGIDLDHIRSKAYSSRDYVAARCELPVEVLGDGY